MARLVVPVVLESTEEAEVLRVERVEGERTRLRVMGELDVFTVGTLEELLDQAEGEDRRVELDLAGLQFMDSTAARRLYRRQTIARQHGRDLVFYNARPFIRRVLDLLGMAGMLTPRLVPHHQVVEREIRAPRH